MVITKNGNFAEALRLLNNGSTTGNVSTEIESIIFYKEYIRIKTNYGNFSVKEKMDFGCILKSPNDFVRILLNALDKGDVEISYKDGLNCCGYSFETEDFDEDDDDEETPGSAHIIFNKDQFEKLGKDCLITKSNYFVSPKTVDAITLMVIQGDIYENVPGSCLAKVSKIDATIDTATINRNFGHDSFGLILPKIAFDFMKGEDEVKLHLDSDCYSLLSENKKLIVNSKSNNSFGTNAFNSRKEIIASIVPSFNFSFFNDFKDIFEIYSKNGNKYANDASLLFKSDGEKCYCKSESDFTLKTVKCSEHFEATVNAVAFKYLLDTVSKDAKYLFREVNEKHYLIIKDNDQYYFLLA